MIFLCLFILSLYHVQMHCARSMESNVHLPLYDSESSLNSDLEKQLRSKLAQKRKTEQRLRQLNEHITENIEYFEEIPHFAVNSSKDIQRKQVNLENEFKRIIGMVGVKYTYRRDFHWRTWREITFPNKKKEVICYRCQNIVNVTESNCTSCHYGGFWVIEDIRPGCSYEILSYNNDDICLAYFWQLKQANSNLCPNRKKFNELSDCNFPMVTNYFVTMDYSKGVAERTLPAICQEREQCDFSTVYLVNSNSIVFRIINTTNNIIYSKLMKRDNRTYSCVDDCGTFNFETMAGKRNEEHIVLNLLSPNKKKRANPRPNHQPNRKKTRTKKFHRESKDAISRNDLLVKKHNNYALEQPLNRKRPKATSVRTTEPSLCKQILLKELLHDMRDENFLFE